MTHLPNEEPGEEPDEGKIELRHQSVKQVNLKPQKVFKKYRPRVYLGMCKYAVVHDICDDKNMKECEDTEDWNLFWYDWSINQSRLSSMRPYQKINHFPAMDELTRKDNLSRNMYRVKKLFKEQYEFFPSTFQLPQQKQDFLTFYQQSKEKGTVYISKPNAACQGKGMKVFKNVDMIDVNDSQVIQEYQTRPYLINGYKFDLRLYVIVMQVVPYPLILFYEDGMARFCTDKYEAPTNKNMKNTYMHLTNYAVNKSNPNFQFNKNVDSDDSGSKWGLSAVFEQMHKDGCDIELLKKKLYDIFIKGLFCGLDKLQYAYNNFRSTMPKFNNQDPFQSQEAYFGSSCFEILGYDVMIDADFNPVLFEINHSPSFQCDTPLDLRIKENLIAGVIDMLDICQDDKILNQKLEEIKSLRSIYKIQTEKDRQILEQKTIEIIKSKKGIKSRKKMPTYASVMQHISKVVQEKKLFQQIYPLPKGEEDMYDYILQQLRNEVTNSQKKYGYQQQQQLQLQINSVPRQPISNTLSTKQLPLIQQNRPPSSQIVKPPIRKPNIFEVRDDNVNIKNQAFDNINKLEKSETDNTSNDQIEMDFEPAVMKQKLVVQQLDPNITKPDPLNDVYTKMQYEMEYGNQNKQISFKGIIKPVLLNQGQMRSEKLEKTIDMELSNRIRALIRTGLREMTEAVIRIGQRGGGAIQQQQKPAQPQKIDVFNNLGGLRSKSNGMAFGIIKK